MNFLGFSLYFYFNISIKTILLKFNLATEHTLQPYWVFSTSAVIIRNIKFENEE